VPDRDGNVARTTLPIQKLHLHDAPLPSRTLIHLPHLRSLRLRDSGIDDQTLDEIRRSESEGRWLEKLEFESESRLSGSSVVRLLKELGT